MIYFREKYRSVFFIFDFLLIIYIIFDGSLILCCWLFSIVTAWEAIEDSIWDFAVTDYSPGRVVRLKVISARNPRRRLRDENYCNR